MYQLNWNLPAHKTAWATETISGHKNHISMFTIRCVRKCTACRNQQETRKKTRGSVLIRRGNFIYNTWCWQGVSSTASILQGWSARLRIYCTVFGNQDCSGTINTRLKQQILSLFFWILFFSTFSYKMVQTTIQNICAVDNLQKKSFDSITVQWYFFQLFFLSSIWNYLSMVHQNPFWTTTSVMRAATHV